MIKLEQTLYIKPLLSWKQRFKTLTKNVNDKLKVELGEAGVKAIKEEMKRSAGKKVYGRSTVHYFVGKSSVTFHLNAIGAYHNFGVRKHKMRYLLKSPNIVVPVKDRWHSGQIVFRTVSRKSMQKPKKPASGWVHPGLAPKNFVSKGLDDVRKNFRSMLSKNLKRYVK